MNPMIEKYKTKSVLVLILAVNSYSLQALDKKFSLSPVDSVLPMLAGLAAILVVIFGLAYLFKKIANFNIVSQNIKILETQAIGHKEKLMIVQIRNQQFLIGVTGQSINQLGELQQVDESDITVADQGATEQKKMPNSFASIYAKFSNRNSVDSTKLQSEKLQSKELQKEQAFDKRTVA